MSGCRDPYEARRETLDAELTAIDEAIDAELTALRAQSAEIRDILPRWPEPLPPADVAAAEAADRRLEAIDARIEAVIEMGRLERQALLEASQALTPAGARPRPLQGLVARLGRLVRVARGPRP